MMFQLVHVSGGNRHRLSLLYPTINSLGGSAIIRIVHCVLGHEFDITSNLSPKNSHKKQETVLFNHILFFNNFYSLYGTACIIILSFLVSIFCREVTAETALSVSHAISKSSVLK